MKVIDFDPGMRISNITSLPSGLVGLINGDRLSPYPNKEFKKLYIDKE